jgi:hypothetical protein
VVEHINPAGHVTHDEDEETLLYYPDEHAMHDVAFSGL